MTVKASGPHSSSNKPKPNYCQNPCNVITIAANFVEMAHLVTAQPVRILVLNGPNLNLLGEREPEQYGRVTLADIMTRLTEVATALNVSLDHLQSNREHELVERAHACRTDGTDGILINPAAFTHTSVALRDAIAAIELPFVEVHLSNVYAREAFRHHSYFSDLALGVITGLGSFGYEAGLQALVSHLR